MAIKIYNYPLWKSKETNTYYTRCMGTVTEISEEVYRELMRHENEDRYEETVRSKRVTPLIRENHDEIPYDTCMDDFHLEDEVITDLMLREFMHRYGADDQIIIRFYLTKEMTSREIEEKYGIPHSVVCERGKRLKKELLTFYEFPDKYGC